ncbi:hypothetical protein [Natrinema marinum]|uniref:hypothetical protein n=1 Tax=Natrinema marinum TaxID=2961598 RepID=UPI0020C90779|nr:hypothetical protein [Natrinema marinum]
MAYARTEGRYVSRSTWSSLSYATMQLMTTITLVALTASLTAVSMGAAEDVVAVALVAIAVIGLGLTLVRLFVTLETSGIPLLEDDRTAAT